MSNEAIQNRSAGPWGVPGYFYLIGALPPLFWAMNFLIARVMRDAIPPFQMSFWRWLVAFAIILPFALPKLVAARADLRREWPFLAILGIVGVTAFNCFIYAALHHTTVVNAALINSLMPVVTFLFALILLRQTLGVQQMFGVLLAFAGAAAIICRGDWAVLLGLALSRGELLVLAGLTFWAAYTVLIKWRPTRLPPEVFLASTFAFGALFHAPLVLWELHTIGAFEFTFESATAIAFFGLFPSVLAYVLWNRTVGALGPGRAGMFMYLMPIFSAGLGVGLLDEPFGIHHLFGIALIFSGIFFVTRPNPGK